MFFKVIFLPSFAWRGCSGGRPLPPKLFPGEGEFAERCSFLFPKYPVLEKEAKAKKGCLFW